MKKGLLVSMLSMLLITACLPMVNATTTTLKAEVPTTLPLNQEARSVQTSTFTAKVASATPSALPAVHALRIDYPDLGGSRSLVDSLEQHARAAGINMIALGAGRVEWTYFKWAGHENAWANDVKDSGIDYLLEDATRFGQWAQVNAVVDIFAPNYIKAHPDEAAISWLGAQSEYLVGTMDLVDGPFGKMVLDMIDAIATNYPVDSISITELFYHSDGYGPKEKAAYMAYTGAADWPRTSDGHIDIDDQTIGNWRGYELDRWLDRAVTIAHAHGKELYMDVALSLDNLSKMTNEHGTNYHLVLEHMDRLVIWAYLDLDNYPPEYLYDIAIFLTQFDQNRIILSVGLWSNDTSVITPDKFKRAILAAQDGYMPNIWITPSSLMQAGHWAVLEDLWGKPYHYFIPTVDK